MQRFFDCYKDVSEVIPYNPQWENGTGYLDYIVKEDGPKIEIGKVVKTETQFGRKILVVGTRLGNVAVFQRFSDREDVIVSHVARKLLDTGLPIKDNLVTQEKLHLILGAHKHEPNIGQLLENIITECMMNNQ